MYQIPGRTGIIYVNDNAVSLTDILVKLKPIRYDWPNLPIGTVNDKNMPRYDYVDHPYRGDCPKVDFSRLEAGRVRRGGAASIPIMAGWSIMVEHNICNVGMLAPGDKEVADSAPGGQEKSIDCQLFSFERFACIRHFTN